MKTIKEYLKQAQADLKKFAKNGALDKYNIKLAFILDNILYLFYDKSNSAITKSLKELKKKYIYDEDVFYKKLKTKIPVKEYEIYTYDNKYLVPLDDDKKTNILIQKLLDVISLMLLQKKKYLEVSVYATSPVKK